MDLSVHWEFSAVFMRPSSREFVSAQQLEVSPTDVGNAVAEVGEIAQSMCSAGLDCPTSPKHEIKLIIVKSPPSVMSEGRTW